MDFLLISSILYLINIIISFLISLTIIHRLYISKNYTKENNFHLYNDLFSWEMFFILIGIANIITIVTLTIPMTTEFSIYLTNLYIVLFFFSFWNKIIHLEKIMDKITYERHGILGGIPCILLLLVILLNLLSVILLYIFLASTFILYLTLISFWRNTGAFHKETMKVFMGVVFIGLGCILLPDIMIIFMDIDENINILIIIAPIFYILGTLLIFLSIHKYLYK